MLLVVGHIIMIYLCSALCTLKPKKPKKPKNLKKISKKPRFFPALLKICMLSEAGYSTAELRLCFTHC